jgi:hypothetical protein
VVAHHPQQPARHLRRQRTLLEVPFPLFSWGIKIFIMPADSLVYVIIVCIVILTILGLILMGIKINRKRQEEKVGLLNDI